MKRITLAAAAVVAIVAFTHRPVLADVISASPWCAVISIGTGSVYWDCQYSTFEACYPNVLGGNRGFCNHNPYYTGAAKRPVRRQHRTRRD
jgi:hypothetical protein